MSIHEFDNVDVTGQLTSNDAFLGSTIYLNYSKITCLDRFRFFNLKHIVPQRLLAIDDTLTYKNQSVGDWLRIARGKGYGSFLHDLFVDSDWEEELTLGGTVTTIPELDFLSGVSSNLQTQLDNISALDSAQAATLVSLLAEDVGVVARLVALESDRLLVSTYNTDKSARDVQVAAIAADVSAIQVVDTQQQVEIDDCFTKTESDSKFETISIVASKESALQGRLDLVEAADYRDGRYFTETESDNKFETISVVASKESALQGRLDTIEEVDYRDGRYFTETESNAKFETIAAVAANESARDVEIADRYTKAESDAAFAEKTDTTTRLTDLENVMDLEPSTLDTWSELKGLWEADDSGLESTLTALANTKVSQTSYDARVVSVDASFTAQEAIDVSLGSRCTALEATYTDSAVDGLLAAKQASLTAGQQAVVDANAFSSALKAKVDDIDSVFSAAEKAKLATVDQIFSSSEKTKLALYDSASALSGLLSAKQDSLSAAQLVVVGGVEYTSGEKTKLAAVDQVFTSAEKTTVALYDSGSALTGLLAAKQASLTAGQQSVVDGETFSSALKAKVDAIDAVFTSAEKTTVALYDSATALSSLLAAKQGSLSVAQTAVVNGSEFTSSEKAKVALYDSASALSVELAVKAPLADPTFTTGVTLSNCNMVVNGTGAGGGIDVNFGDVSVDASKSFKVDSTHLAKEELYCDSGDFTIKNHMNHVTSGDIVFSTRTGGATYHNSAFKVLAAGNISTGGSCTVAGGLTVQGTPIIFSALPTSDPGVTGALWSDSGTLKISS